jgi:hypothetical protein
MCCRDLKPLPSDHANESRGFAALRAELRRRLNVCASRTLPKQEGIAEIIERHGRMYNA